MTSPWRFKARQILDPLVSSPVLSRKACAYSFRVPSFLSLTSERSTAPSSSSRIERKPRPCGFGARRPSWCNWRNQLPTALSDRLILGFGVLAAEPRGATIGPMSDSRSCLPSKAIGCCDGGHRPSAGTDHGFAADDQSDLLDR